MWRSFAALFLLTLTACAPPVGVRRLDARTVHHNLSANAISSGEPSQASRNVLQRWNLFDRMDEAPADALGKLHEIAMAGGDREALFALAELSFIEGERSSDHAWHRAAALYAWAFLFGAEPTGPFDPRASLATELYNRGLTEGLSSADGEWVELESGVYPLPFGDLEVAFDDVGLEWNGRHLHEFIPVAELDVHGLRSRFHRNGIGAPLAASAAVANPDESDEFVAPRLKIAVTALLRVAEPVAQLRTGHVRATLELFSDPYVESVDIAGQKIPLESEQTAAIAAMLADLPIWKQELAAFLGSVSRQADKGRLVALRPHRRGAIPVIFVHGTASSPGRWAEMINVLDHDPAIRGRFEPWFFFYNSGSPIIYSAYLLRKALSTSVAAIDSSGDDACLRDMVVIGHSQGGLLTKMTAVDGGDAFWRAASTKSFDEIRLEDDERTLFRDALFVKPLPFVKRVVFIATPHGGSFLAAGTLVRSLMQKLVSLPSRVKTLTESLVSRNADVFDLTDIGTFTAVDSMSPSHRFIRTISKIPVSPGISAHSIIAVEGDGPIEEGDDGVVAYASAHIEGVESEKVVRSPHSTQSHPETIEEVRRILRVHAEDAASCPDGVQGSAPNVD